MIRKFLNSEIKLVSTANLIMKDYLYDNKEQICVPSDKIKDYLLDSEEQIYVQSETVKDSCLIVEYVNRKDICELIPFGAMQNNGKIEPLQDDKKVEEFRAIVLRTDPFSRYSGLTLGEIVDQHDLKWINQVVKNMTNTYIREKVEYLAKYYKLI